MYRGVRSSTAGRNARELIEAKAAWREYDYAKRFPLPKKGAKAEGIRFEKQIVKSLEEKYPGFISALPFIFSTPYNPRSVCIPDGLLVDKDEVVVVEIKLRHTMDAWFQLRQLYEPVIKKALRRERIRLVEVCKWYVPETKFPEKYEPVQTMEEFLGSREEFGVVIWGRG